MKKRIVKILKTQKQKVLWFLTIAFFLANFLDLVSTLLALKYKNGLEANPFFTELDYSDFAIIKFGAFFLIAGLIVYIHSRFHDIQKYFISHSLQDFLYDAKLFKTIFTLKIKTARVETLSLFFVLVVTGTLMFLTAVINNILVLLFNFGILDSLITIFQSILSGVFLSMGIYYAIIVGISFIIWFPISFILTRKIFLFPEKIVPLETSNKN